MSRTSSDFGVGSVWGNIVRLAVPMILAQLVNVLYSVVDRIYIGHIPGASAWAMTGIGLVMPVISIIAAFSNLFGMGGAPLFAMARGAQNTERAGKIMGNTFSMLIITAMVLSVMFFVFKKPLLYLFGASDVTYPYARDYLNIYLIGTVFVMISLGMNGFINAQGFGMVGMLTVSIGAVLNLILDPVFIFVFDMGVKGAAIATVIAQFASALWVMRFLTGKKAVIRLEKVNLPVSIPMVKEITSLGLAGFIMGITNGLVQIVCNASLQFWGGDLYVGIMTVINSVREIITLPAMGLTSGAQPVISFNYGAKKYDRVKSAIKFMTAACISLTFAAWLILITIPHVFIQMFNNEPALLEYGVPAMHIYFFGMFMMAFQFSGTTVFTALGKAKYSVFFSIFRKVIIVTPLTLIIPFIGGLGTKGVFLAEPISNFVGGLACYITMLVTVWPLLKEDDKKSLD